MKELKDERNCPEQLESFSLIRAKSRKWTTVLFEYSFSVRKPCVLSVGLIAIRYRGSRGFLSFDYAKTEIRSLPSTSPSYRFAIALEKKRLIYSRC